MFPAFYATRNPDLLLPQRGARGELLPDAPTSPILSREVVGHCWKGMLPFYDRLAQQTGNDDQLRAKNGRSQPARGCHPAALGPDPGNRLKPIGEPRSFSGMGPAHHEFESKLEVAQIDNELGRLYSRRDSRRPKPGNRICRFGPASSEAALPAVSPGPRAFRTGSHVFLSRHPGAPASCSWTASEEAGPAPIPEEQRD